MKLLDTPEARRQLADALAETDVHLPLHSYDNEPGIILDARGEIFLIVDESFAPESAARLANMTALAINAYAQHANGAAAEVVP